MFELPLFPLHTVLFPSMPIHLHIFEDRYRQMVHHCLQKDQPFGVVLIREGLEVYQKEVEIYKIGCTAHISQIENLKDGRMNIIARGEKRFQILKTNRINPYLSAHAETISLTWQNSAASDHNLSVFRRQMRHYLKILSRVHEESGDVSELDLPDDALMLLNLGASILQIPSFEKQILLELESGLVLLEKLQHIFRRETAVLKAIHRREKSPTSQDIRNN